MAKIKDVFKDKAFIKSFIRLVVPVMLSTLVINIINLADNVMIGNYSDAAVSAVFATNQMTFVFNILIFGIVGGAGIFIQQFSGKGDEKHLIQVFRFKLYAVVTLIIIALPLLFIFKEDLILLFLSADANKVEVLSLALKYFDIVVFSFIPFIFSVAFSTTLREMGKPMPPLISAGASLVTNVIINGLLINGVAKMGVQGAAIGTVCARVVELIVITLLVIRLKLPFMKKPFDGWRIERDLVKRIGIATLPVSLNELLWSLSVVVLSSLYSRTGTVLSALSIANTASEIFNIIFVGFASGIGIFVGHKLGEGNLEKAKENASKLVTLSVLVSIVGGLLLIGLSFILPLMYNKVDSSQKALATKLIMIFGAAVPSFAFNSTTSNIYRAGGRTCFGLLIDGGATWGLSVVMAAVLVLNTSLPLVLIYLCVYAMDYVKLSFTIPLYKKKNVWAQDLVKSY